MRIVRELVIVEKGMRLPFRSGFRRLSTLHQAAREGVQSHRCSKDFRKAARELQKVLILMRMSRACIGAMRMLSDMTGLDLRVRNAIGSRQWCVTGGKSSARPECSEGRV